MSLFAASTEGYDLALILGNLLVIILVARLAAELAERIKIPAVLGEIVAGIVIGPSVLGLIDPISNLDVANMVLLLGEIGVILLLLQVGLEMDLGELGKVGKSALLVAVIGVVVPFAAGFGVSAAFGESGKIALFIGAALTATSVGITARVLGDLRALSRTESRIVLGAAVADDVLGLVILTVVVKVVTEGTISAGVVLETFGLALGFLLITGLLAIYVIPKALDRIHRHARSSTTVVAVALVITLGLSLLANEAKLAFIIGAFMAGLGIGRSPQHERIAEGLNPLGHIFIPVFFASIGINADLGAMFEPEVLALAGALTVVAILGKLASSFGVAGAKVDRLLIGIGMIPRGEVGLIFASIGLSKGILDENLYGALLLMVLVTTVMTPPLLNRRLKGSRNESPLDAWTTLDTSALVKCLVHDNPSQWDESLSEFRVEDKIPQLARKLSRLRAEPDTADIQTRAFLNPVQHLRDLIDAPDRDAEAQSVFKIVGDVETLFLAALIEGIIDDGSDAVALAELLCPGHGNKIMRVLSASETMKDAARGPDYSIPDTVGGGDRQILASAYLLAIVTSADHARPILDQVIGSLLRPN